MNGGFFAIGCTRLISTKCLSLLKFFSVIMESYPQDEIHRFAVTSPVLPVWFLLNFQNCNCYMSIIHSKIIQADSPINHGKICDSPTKSIHENFSYLFEKRNSCWNKGLLFPGWFFASNVFLCYFLSASLLKNSRRSLKGMCIYYVQVGLLDPDTAVPYMILKLNEMAAMRAVCPSLMTFYVRF